MVLLSESTWTRPTSLCPHPEWWNAYDEQTAEYEVGDFLYGLVRLLQPETVIETGTAYGYTALKIGEALEDNGHGYLVTMETDRERVEAARKRVSGLPVNVLDQSSLTYVPDRPVDLAFFDSDFDLRVKEFDHYVQYAGQSAIALFHDTAAHHPLRPQLAHLDLLHFPTPRGLSIGRLE